LYFLHAAACRGRMKDPGFQNTPAWLLWVALLALTGTVLAQPPETGPNKTPAARTKPQVIYHLPPSSNYAATLHSQAKGQNNDLPIDSSMPASVQMSRANANAAAVQAQQEAATPPLKESSGKPPKLQSNRSFHSKPSVKVKGRGNSPGNSHKK
jgi:hypothetical protein